METDGKEHNRGHEAPLTDANSDTALTPCDMDQADVRLQSQNSLPTSLTTAEISASAADGCNQGQLHIVRALQSAVWTSTSILLLPDTNIYLLRTSAGLQLLKSLLEKGSSFIQFPGMPHAVQVQNVMQIHIPYICIQELNSMKDRLRDESRNINNNVASTEPAAAETVTSQDRILQQRLISQTCELIHEYHRMMQLQSFEDHTQAYETFIERFGAEYSSNDAKILATAIFLRDLPEARIPIIVTNDQTFALMAKSHQILAADVANLYMLNEFITKYLVKAEVPFPPSPPMSTPVAEPCATSIAGYAQGAHTQQLSANMCKTSTPLNAAQSRRQQDYLPAGGRAVVNGAAPGGFMFYNSNKLHQGQITANSDNFRPPVQQYSNPHMHIYPSQHGQLYGNFRPAFSVGFHMPEMYQRAAADEFSSTFSLENTPQNLLFYKQKLTTYLQDLLNIVLRLEIYTRALEQSRLPLDMLVEERCLTEESVLWLTHAYTDDERLGKLPNVLDVLLALQRHNRALLDNYARELRLERLLDNVVSRTRPADRRSPPNDLPKCTTFKDVHRWGLDVVSLLRALSQRQPPWSPSFVQQMRRKTPQFVLSRFREILDRIKVLCELNGLGIVEGGHGDAGASSSGRGGCGARHYGNGGRPQQRSNFGMDVDHD